MQVVLYNLVIGSRCYIENNSTGIEVFNGVVSERTLRIKTKDIRFRDSVLVRVRKASGGVYCKPYEKIIIASGFKIKLRVEQEYDFDMLTIPEKHNRSSRLKRLFIERHEKVYKVKRSVLQSVLTYIEYTEERTIPEIYFEIKRILDQ